MKTTGAPLDNRSFASLGTRLCSMLITLFLGMIATTSATLAEVGEFSEGRLSAARQEASKNENAETLTELGKQLVRKYDTAEDAGVRAEAERVLDKALSLDSSSVEAMAWKALVKGINARNKEDKTLARQALDDLDRALAKDPSNLMVLYANATVSSEVPKDWGRLEQAGERMKKVEKELSSDPEKAEAYDINLASVYYRLGKIYQEHRDFDTAISYWQKSVEVGASTRLGRKSQRMIERYTTGERGKKE